MGKSGEISYNTLNKAYCFNGRTFCILWDVQGGFLVWKLLKSVINKFPLHTPYSTLTSPTLISTKSFLEGGIREWG